MKVFHIQCFTLIAEGLLTGLGHGRPQAMGKGHLPPPPRNVAKCFLCCNVVQSLSIRSIYELFRENVPQLLGASPQTPTGALPLDHDRDFRPSDPFIALHG